ncbi:MAG: hypothetical protein JW881_00515 [Spirochaetales bacterium]|nr:hypothetical protein [Spirochaetales bacterium]
MKTYRPTRGNNKCPDFNTIFHRYSWKPIRGCPGRYVSNAGMSSLTIPEVVGMDIEVHCCTAAAAKDPVLFAALTDGGIISYKKEDGSFVHTLNTDSGFRRKLTMLGLMSSK